MASILPALSENPHERTVLASCRTFFSSVGSTVVSAFVLTLVDKFGNGNEALGFRIVMIIFGVIGCLVFFFCFFNTKERVMVQAEKVSLKANISCLLHNGPWKLFALNIVWFFGGYVIQASNVIYYFTYVVQNVAMVQIVATITILVPIVTNLLVPFLIKLTSKRNLMIGGSVVHAGGLLIIFFGGTNVQVLIGGAVIAAAGYGLKGSMHFAMQPDPVDYGEWKSGINLERRYKKMVKLSVKIVSMQDADKFNKICSKFGCDMDLQSGKYYVDAKSIMGITSECFPGCFYIT